MTFLRFHHKYLISYSTLATSPAIAHHFSEVHKNTKEHMPHLCVHFVQVMKGITPSGADNYALHAYLQQPADIMPTFV